MTINSERVLNFMKENYGKEFSKQEIADALGISLSAVIGSINPLEKKGYSKVTREEVVELEAATETRKAKTKTVKIKFNTNGFSFKSRSCLRRIF